MPDIVFDREESVLELVHYEEADHIYTATVGVIYQGTGYLKDGRRADMVVKLPTSASRVSLIEAEYETLQQLAAETARFHPQGRSYTPLVQLGWRKDDDLAALVMPLYTRSLHDTVRAAIREGDLIQADRLAIRAALEFTYILDGLHALEKTCTDRKVKDMFLYDGGRGEQLIVIDWNILQDDTPENRAREIRVAVGQIWHELFLGRKESSAPLDDSFWQPLEGTIPGGIPCLGLRFALGQTIVSEHPNRAFGSDVEKLRETLAYLDKLVNSDLSPDAHPDFQPDMLGPFIRLTSDEVLAIGGDLIWRAAGADPGSPLFKERNDALAAGRYQDDGVLVTSLEKLTAKGDYRQALDDINVLQNKQDIKANQWQQLQRWRLLLESLRDRDDRVADLLFQNRDMLLDIWTRLDRIGWDYLPPETLHEFQTALREIIARISERSESQAKLAQADQEILLRYQWQVYRQESVEYQRRAAATASPDQLSAIYQEHLDHLENVQRTLDSLPGQHFLIPANIPASVSGVDLLGGVRATLELDRARLESQLHAEEATLRAIEKIYTQLAEDRVEEARRTYEQQLRILRDNNNLSAVESFVTDSKPLYDLITFHRFSIQGGRASLLAHKLTEAVELKRDPELQRRKLAGKPLEWLEPEIKTAYTGLVEACQQRTFAAVNNPETATVYRALHQQRGLFSAQYQDTLDDYAKLAAFFNRFVQGLIDLRDASTRWQTTRRTVEERGAALRPEDWYRYLREAREVNANMADLLNIDTETWREFLRLDEAAQNVEGIIDDLKAALGKRFDDLNERLDDQLDELRQRTNRVTDLNDRHLASTQQGFRTIAQTLLNLVITQADAGLAAARAFDQAAALAAHERTTQFYNELAPFRDQLQPQEQKLIDALRILLNKFNSELTSLGEQRLEYYQRIHYFLRRGEVPEQIDPRFNQIVKALETDAPNFELVTMLQDHYWMIRLEHSRDLDFSAERLTDRLHQIDHDLSRQLVTINDHFQAGEPSKARDILKKLRYEFQQPTLGSALVYELMRLWEARLAGYETCLEKIDAAQETLAALRLPAEKLIALLDSLVDAMYLCPADAFTSNLFNRWREAVEDACTRLNEHDYEVAPMRETWLAQARKKTESVTIRYDLPSGKPHDTQSGPRSERPEPPSALRRRSES